MLGGYLSKIVDAVAMSDAEYDSSMDAGKIFIDKLQLILPEIEQIKIFGSITRRTNLSKEIDKKTDIDIFLVNAFESQMVRTSNYTKEHGDGFDAYWLNALLEKIRTNAVIPVDDIEIDSPSINVVSEGIKFQLTPATLLENGSYIFARRISKWEKENEELLVEYMGAGASDPLSDNAIFHTDPFYLTELSHEYQKVCGDAWKMLIIILKYWKFVHCISLTSYMIEDNVFKALNNIKVFQECDNLFDLLRVFLANDNLYHAALFNTISEFSDLKKACLDAAAYFEQEELEKSFMSLARVIPPPSLLERYPCSEPR